MLKYTIPGAATLLLATAPQAWALDAQTVWSDWQDVYSRFGGTLTAASEEYSGGTLTLTDVTYETVMGEVTNTAGYGTLTLVEQDDGSVVIEIPATVETTNVTETDGVSIEQTMRMIQDGLTVVAREEDGTRTYDMAADSITVEIDTEAQADEESISPGVVTVAMSNVVSVYRSDVDADGAFSQTLAADTMTVQAAMEDDTGSTVDVSYGMTGITSDLAGNYGDAPTGPIRGLSDMGVTYGGDMTHSGSTLSVAGDGPDGPFRLDGTSEAGTLALDLGADALTYSLTSTGGDMVVQVPGFPVPVNISMAELASGFQIPVGAPGEEQPFGMTVTLRDLMVDDMLWGLFDPTGQLPRDPATLILDLDGTALMSVDLFGDPDAMANLQGPPGELKTLAINQILLTLAGASLRGSGDLDFPTSAPIPEPVGKIDLALDGGFALIDKIVALGFIPVQQAAFVKGMAGAVAKPVGDDQLESTIEFLPGGGISANGLPLK